MKQLKSRVELGMTWAFLFTQLKITLNMHFLKGEYWTIVRCNILINLF
jgi:hypothetical protein